MTETIEPTTSDAGSHAAPPKKKSGGLNTMLLADLKSMAGGLGIRGTGSMKKAQLVEAIKAAQSGGTSGGTSGGQGKTRVQERGQGGGDARREGRLEARVEGRHRPGRPRPR